MRVQGDRSAGEGSNAEGTGSRYGNGIKEDYATVKYDADGNELWLRRYSGPGNHFDYSKAPKSIHSVMSM